MIDDIDLSVEEYDADVGNETGRLVRPYAMTGGRTGVDTDISLESQIQASTRGRSISVPTAGKPPN